MHHLIPPRRVLALAALTGLLLSACEAGPEPPDAAEPQPVTLGPADGFDLPPQDLTRVAVGDEAPGFALESFSGDTVQLSEYRGGKNVVLVFYRGHW